MEVALIGLGKLGGNRVERPTSGGDQAVAYDRGQAVMAAAGGGTTATSLEGVVGPSTCRPRPTVGRPRGQE